jgi:SWI/SNF chromatin-remodeling complex subunit SWI1
MTLTQSTERPGGSNNPVNAQAAVQSRNKQQMPMRRKIEYVPLAREIESYGGRDLQRWDSEIASAAPRRAIRDVNDWGIVEVDALMMSIRSRLSTEVAYALGTLSVLSTIRNSANTALLLFENCPDLLEEILDLLVENAFRNTEDTFSPPSLSSDPVIITNRELINAVHESDTHPFSILQDGQGCRDRSLGPSLRAGTIILTITNILRNSAAWAENANFLAFHPAFLDILLRLCATTSASSAASPAMTLNDLINVRKDVLYILFGLAHNLQFAEKITPLTIKTVNRAFQLVASYLIDYPEELSLSANVPSHPGRHPRPPLLADVALDVFTRMGLTDRNRQIISRTVPRASILRLFRSLVHRLPVSEQDFELLMREQWMSYLDKNVMALYSLAFLASPDIKQKVKSDHSLGFRNVMLRMVQKMTANPEPRGWFAICIRRSVETMKVIDDAEDSFDTSKSTVAPTLSFGMGYGEIGDNGPERGTGLLGGQRQWAWDLLMRVGADDVAFGELESLSRVDVV